MRMETPSILSIDVATYRAPPMERTNMNGLEPAEHSRDDRFVRN